MAHTFECAAQLLCSALSARTVLSTWMTHKTARDLWTKSSTWRECGCPIAIIIDQLSFATPPPQPALFRSHPGHKPQYTHTVQTRTHVITPNIIAGQIAPIASWNMHRSTHGQPFYIAVNQKDLQSLSKTRRILFRVKVRQSSIFATTLAVVITFQLLPDLDYLNLPWLEYV